MLSTPRVAEINPLTAAARRAPVAATVRGGFLRQIPRNVKAFLLMHRVHFLSDGISTFKARAIKHAVPFQ